MSDNLDDELIFSSPEKGGRVDADLVAFADCDRIRLNSQMMLVINRQNGRQKIISPDVIEGLKDCTTFKTADAHAQELSRRRPELKGQQQMVTQALHNLKSAGMLLQASEVCARLADTTPVTLSPTRAFIITCDRPAAVERLLDSMLQHGRPSQHDALFLVDDSREPANRDANREAVARFNLSSPRNMHYVGEEIQRALISGLAAELPQHAEGARFLLDRSRWEGTKTYGRSRTLCLLLSVGYRALVMDDDILCQTVLPPVSEEGVGIGSGARQAAFYRSAEEMFQQNRFADFDPLSGHAVHLGSTLGQALRELNGGPLRQAQLLDCNAALANVLRADSPILVTQSGSMGDPGTGSAHWVLIQGEASMQRLLRAPHGLREATENRLSWLGSPKPFIYKMPFMSQLTGMDNSHLLPPYFPAFRGEDALFGAMLVAIQPQGVALEYPWSVPHLPLETRAYSVDGPIAGRGDMTIFSRYLTEHVDYDDSTTPEHNLHFLAQDLLRIAARSDNDLLLDFRRELARGQASYLTALQDQLARTETFGSEELQSYLRRGIAELQEVIMATNSPSGMGQVPAGTTDADLLAQFRGMARGFSAALDGWVDMRKAASALCDQWIGSGAMLPR